jgi:hypothetical protein
MEIYTKNVHPESPFTISVSPLAMLACLGSSGLVKIPHEQNRVLPGEGGADRMVAAAKPEARLPCSTSAQRFQFLPLLGILLLQSTDARNETFSIIVEAILGNIWSTEVQCHGTCDKESIDLRQKQQLKLINNSSNNYY